MKLGQLSGLAVSLEHDVLDVDTTPEVIASVDTVEDWSCGIDDGLSALNQLMTITAVITENSVVGINPQTAEITSVAIESIKRKLGIKTDNPVLSLEAYRNPITRKQATSISCEGVSEFLMNVWEGIKAMMAKFFEFIKGLFARFGKEKDSFGSNPSSTKNVVEKLNSKVERVKKAKQQAAQSGNNIKPVQKVSEIQIPAFSRTLNLNKDHITVKDVIDYLDNYKKLEAAVYDVVNNSNGICGDLSNMIERLIKSEEIGGVIDSLPAEVNFLVTTPYDQTVDRSEKVIDKLLDNEVFYKWYYGGNDKLLFKGDFVKEGDAGKSDSVFIVPENESEVNKLIHALSELSRDYSHNDDIFKQVEESHKIYKKFEAEMDKLLANPKDLTMLRSKMAISHASNFVSRVVKSSMELQVKLLARRKTLGRSCLTYVDHMTRQMVNNVGA